MPGQKRKKNARCFLEALLIYTSPESQGVYEERLEINFDWKESTGRFYRLVVRTTLKELERLVASDPKGGKLSRFQIREVLWECLRNFLEILEDNREKTQGAENLHFTLRLWSKNKEENLLQFDQEWERRVLKLPSPNSCSQPKGDINWQQLCRTYLQLQRSLASNVFSAGMGIRFALDELHVPLGLVERQQKSQRWMDFDPELGSRVYQDEKVVSIDYDDFFDRVLARGQSPKSRGSRLAIIGEPGAGKTVQLLKIGDWLLNQAVGLPIWISLGAVGKKPLDQYLTEDWLRMALGKAGLMSVHAEAACKFEQLLNQGQVWLLLDGADEMRVPDPLGTLADQLRVPLLQNVRVVLTSRVNLWDALFNALDEFDTYKMLDFSFGEGNKSNQVKLFIDNWFSSSNPSSGWRLWQQLNQTEMTRIKDLSRNPLRLALLCVTWATGQETLPKTKAGLYKVFVQALYRFKQKVFPTTLRERSDLNAAFGKLALQAFAFGYKSVFPSDLVEKELNQGELFEKALELAWLNQVGVEKDNWSQPIYAFFHPTFAEYFAALAIDDWHFFLNHIPDNPSHSNASYRIFERQWKEVILLWLGREDVPNKEKEAFIKALIEFSDGSPQEKLYEKRAYLLAAAGIAEFIECRRSEEIVQQLIKWSFGYFDKNKQQWQMSSLDTPLKRRARAALKETQRNRAITALVQLISTLEEDEYIRMVVAESLIAIDPNNPIAIDTLIQIICTTKDDWLRGDAAKSLEQIGQGSPTAIQVLTELLESTNLENNELLLQCLGKIDPGNSMAISGLEDLARTGEDEWIRMYAAISLGEIDPGNSTALATWLQTIQKVESDSDNFSLDWLNLEGLEQVARSNSTTIRALEEFVRNTEVNHPNYEYAVKCLGSIAPDNPGIINLLEQLIEKTKKTKDNRICWQAKASLVRIKPDHPAVGSILRQVIERNDCEEIRLLIAETLMKIEPSNPAVIAALIQLSQTAEEEIIWRATESLGQIHQRNLAAIKALVQLIERVELEDDGIWLQAVKSLGKIDPGNPLTTSTLVLLIQSPDNHINAAESLIKIWPDDQLAKLVTILKNCCAYKFKFSREELVREEEYNEVLWYCAENLPYSAFYQAWSVAQWENDLGTQKSSYVRKIMQQELY